ncbi:MAG: signal recognition particle-docking protein FtsY, partial [Candidatus Micrarchaeota archaeon]
EAKEAKGAKEKIEVKLSLESKARALLLSEIEIREKDVDDLLANLETSLLEADVAYEVSRGICEELRKRLVGMKVHRNRVSESVREAIRDVLVEKLGARRLDFVGAVERAQRPVKILFLGPNGAGKTTTMAKLARLLGERGIRCVFSASDTFRAAAIEQTEHHGKKLGIQVIKHKYGADPAAVAFDAINYAKAHGIDAVLIDSSGRQETNVNLLDELKKVVRIAKPDLKIFIGESIAGNAIVEQVRKFNEVLGLDGVILTKIDCDAKGGGALSIAQTAGVPIVYIGTGQRYEDLEEFDARKIVDEILS